MITHTDNLRVIVIDDNPDIQSDFIKILSSNKSETNNDSRFSVFEKELFNKISVEKKLPNFEVDTASQGKEGVDKISKALNEGEPYALAFVDIRMPPGWDGIETIKHIWEIDKNIQVVICTAYSDYTWEETVEQLGEKDNLLILKKPFDTTSLRQLTCALTKRWQLLHELKQYTLSLENSVKDVSKTLNESLSLVDALVESSKDGILITDKNGLIYKFNKNFEHMLEIPSLNVDNKSFDKIIEDISNKLEDSDKILAQVRKIKEDSINVLTGTIIFKDKRIYTYACQPYHFNNTFIGRIWKFNLNRSS